RTESCLYGDTMVRVSIRHVRIPALFPYTTLFRSMIGSPRRLRRCRRPSSGSPTRTSNACSACRARHAEQALDVLEGEPELGLRQRLKRRGDPIIDRKSVV